MCKSAFLRPLGLGLVAGLILVTGCEATREQLEREARIPEAEARQTALARVPGGAVKEAELEREGGRLIWSFDLATPGTRDVTEVLVDAVTGAVVSTDTETPEEEADEAVEEHVAAGRKDWEPTLSPVDEPLATTGRNDFFILEPGYELALHGREGGKTAELTVRVLPETKEINGVFTRVVEERETADGELAEVSRNFLAFGTVTGNIYYLGEEVDEYRDGRVVSHAGAWREGTDGARRGILLPGRVRLGGRYYQEQAPGIAMDRAENVSVTATFETPAGGFKDCLKTKETTPLEGGTEYKLYAPGVGLIQDGDLRLVRHGFVK